MRFDDAIDLYIADMRAYGRINSDRTEVTYRQQLLAHGEDVENRDPRKTGRGDVKRTLNRWAHPNTRRRAHAALTSFYDWAMEEGLRKDNPARQIRRAKPRETSVYRLTRAEVVALMDACETVVERRVIHIGALAGLRNAELRGLRGQNFARVGAIWVDGKIAKGGRERWVPVLAELEETVAEVVEHVAPDEFVVPAMRVLNPPLNTLWKPDPTRGASSQLVWRLVGRVGRRAGIAHPIHPHLLRHAFGDHAAKYAGLRAAQEALGHADVNTTAGTYVDRTTLDELSVSFHGFSYRGYPLSEHLAIPGVETAGIEPAHGESRPTTDDGGRDAVDGHGQPRGTT